MAMVNMGPHTYIQKGVQFLNSVRVFDGDGFPKSGTSGTGIVARTGKGAPQGSLYIDKTSKCVFVNEGSITSPYWTPMNFQQQGLFGWFSDFRDAVGKALADTAATATISGSGLRVHGTNITAVDSGLVIAMSDQGAVGSLTASAADASTAVLSVGNGIVPVFQPDQNGTVVVDAMVAQSSALTLRAFFLGFCGSAADALIPMTYSATTISFAATTGDDIAGLAFSAELTDADRWFAPHDKANTNASIATTATGVDTGVDVTAAGTYQRLRVECDADGAVRCFIDKVLVASFAAGCLDVDEEIHPMCYVESTSAAVKTALLKHFMAYGKRVA